MKNKFNTILMSVLLSASFGHAAFSAVPTAQTVSVKMGYFNLNQVKANFAEAASALSMEERAKEMLRREVENANKELAEMQKENKPKEEIEKKSKDLQTTVVAKQQALSQLLSNNSMEANRAIAQAVMAVAKEKGLDVIVDANGIYAGGEKFNSSGEDITELVLKRLTPNAPQAPAH